MRAPVAAALAALALVASGCYSKRERAAHAARTVEVLVTRDFGTTRLAVGPAAAGQSVLAALQQVARVRTAYGGRFVDAIDGVSGGQGGTHGWVYFVNGLEADVGAAAVQLHAGDRVWWDERYYPDVERPVHPVPLGLFPEPFVHGAGGRPPRVEVRGSVALAVALARDGVHVVARAQPWRVLVGSDAALRADAVYRRVSVDLAASGVTAAISHGRVVVYDGRRDRAVAGARAAAFAVEAGASPGDGVLLAVAGLDGAAARAAARAIAHHPALLDARYAVAFDGRGRLVATGGRP